MTLRESTAALFGGQGSLEPVVGSYEPRAAQLEMAGAVASAIEYGAVLLAEAGTGTGKTLAYLVPAILSGRKVVISTATRHLQEQAARSALALSEAGGGRVTAVLKGRSNYICSRRLFLAPSLTADGTLKRVLKWAERTQTGDRSECGEVAEDDPVWGVLASDMEDCLSYRCPSRRRCFMEAARQRAAEADVVIVNHHLLFSDLAVRAAGGGGVLPDFEAVILDEAHAVEEVAAGCFGHSVDALSLNMLLGSIQGLARPRSKEKRVLKTLCSRVHQTATDLFNTFSGGRSGPWQRRFDANSLPAGAPTVHLSLDDAIGELAREVSGIAGRDDPPDDAEPLKMRLSALRSDLVFLLEARTKGFVYYAEGDGRAVRLRAVPLSVGPILRKTLYELAQSVVFTSATLSAGGEMEYTASRLGLSDAPHEELIVDSPFDFPSQACLYVPAALPDPNDPRFQEEAANEIERLAAVTGGRAFVLCTSRRNMDYFHSVLKGRLPYTVYRQGDLPKSEILARYIEGRHGVLFATASFWEGVDVPGDALSLVIIDRIPFSPTEEPVTQARMEKIREEGRDPFTTYQLPKATLDLKQGFGRLIRTSTDRGIVAVLDSRMVSKGYGRYIIRSLPRVGLFKEFEGVKKWWGEKRTM
jgi:ATP-dependent DNA helicase DinG